MSILLEAQHDLANRNEMAAQDPREGVDLKVENLSPSLFWLTILDTNQHDFEHGHTLCTIKKYIKLVASEVSPKCLVFKFHRERGALIMKHIIH